MIGVEASRTINPAGRLAVGLFFGYYPARRAARMPPAVAMRYD